MSVFLLNRPWYSTRFFEADDPGGGGNPEDDPAETTTSDSSTSQGDSADAWKARLARAEKKIRAEVEASVRAQIESEAVAKRQKEQGEFEQLYEAEQAKVVDLQRQIDDLTKAAQQRELDIVRRTMATRYGLPDELASRLTGDDDAAIEADAKALAKTIKVNPADTEGGAGGRSSAKSKGASTPGYTFRRTAVVPFPGHGARTKE